MAKKKAARKKATRRGVRAGGSLPAKYRDAIEKARTASVGGSGWKPTKDGEWCAGEILSFEWREGTDKPYCSVSIDDENTGGALMVNLGTVLMMRFSELAIETGDHVVLVFRGEAESGGRAGHPPKLYAVEIVHQSGSGLPVVTPAQLADVDAAKERKNSKRRTTKKKATRKKAARKKTPKRRKRG